MKMPAKAGVKPAFRDRPTVVGGKSQTKIPPKMDHPPWRLTGLYEKAPRKNDVFFLYKGKDWSGWLQSFRL